VFRVVNGKNDMHMENSFIPQQKVGNKLDLTSITKLDSNMEALSFFELVKDRLLAINQWDEICNAPSAVFRLINSKNQEIAGFPQEGDYIRIDVPGPGTKAGRGYDWVRIEKIGEQQTTDAALLSITVRPSTHPLHSEEGIAHFFQATATSTFQVKRYGNMVQASVHGRNEQANNINVGFTDKIRNTMIGWLAKLGLSYPQWKLLTDGLVKKNS